MRIAIDVDSTLHHYWDVLSEAARRRFGVTLPYEEQHDWGLTRLRPEQLQCVVDETHSEQNILNAKPYPGAVEAINAWAAAGHWIHVTSHRAGACHEATGRWLAAIGLHVDDLHCSFDKITRCVELDIDLLIDDSPLNIAGALEVGITPATILHPWNRDVVEDEGVLHAADWPALASVLEAALPPLRRRAAAA
jgi:FMN phosphatase YigB (HAD superfamily)